MQAGSDESHRFLELGRAISQTNCQARLSWLQTRHFSTPNVQPVLLPCRTFNYQGYSNIYTHRIPPSKLIQPNMTEEPRKRSRFDQTEPPEPKRASRFDRRSRSPSSRKSESRRSRSPISSAGPMSPSSAERKKIDPAAAAAAAAAKINAQIQARKGIQHVDVPPIRSVHQHPHKYTT